MTSRHPVKEDLWGTVMFGMDAWDWILLAMAAYVAVIALVRLMQRRRESIIQGLTEQVEIEQQRLKAERKKGRQRQLRAAWKRQRQDRRASQTNSTATSSDRDAA